MNRRQFCGLLGATIAGSVMLDSLYESPKSVHAEEINKSSRSFSAAKIPSEAWFAELRHKSARLRQEELRKRFSVIRESSEVVVFLSAVGLSAVFQSDLLKMAKETGLRVFVPPSGDDVVSAALNTIQQETPDYSTVAFSLGEAKDRSELIASSNTRRTSGYLYVRFFHESQIAVPQAIVSFETSRCLWELYVSADCFSVNPPSMEPVWNDDLRRECARLLDQTNVLFSGADAYTVCSVMV